MYHGSLIGFFNPISPVDVLWLCQYNQDKSWWCVCFFSSSVGLSMPSGWSACARYTGIRSPPRGHWQPVCWATIAHSVGNECPNIGFVFGQYSLGSLRCLNNLFALFKLTFLDVFVAYFRLLIAFFCFLLVFLWCISKNWWYFHDTSFAIFREASFDRIIWELDI